MNAYPDNQNALAEEAAEIDIWQEAAVEHDRLPYAGVVAQDPGAAISRFS